MSVKLEELVKAYIAIRNKRDANAREFDANDAIELLQQRIHQTNFKEFLSNRTDEGLPPGISTMREFQIVVRKPSK